MIELTDILTTGWIEENLVVNIPLESEIIFIEKLNISIRLYI